MPAHPWSSTTSFPRRTTSPPRLSRATARSPRRSGEARRRRRRAVPLGVQTLEHRRPLAADVTGTPWPASLAKVDTVAPAVTSVTAPTAKTYAVGGLLTFTVRFGERVRVTGTPTLPVEIGGTVRDVAWTGRGSRSTSLTFATRVAAGDLDADGIRIAGPIGLPAGALIRDAAGNDAARAVPAKFQQFPKVLADGVAPAVTGFGTPVVTSKKVSLQITFDEPVIVKGRPTVPFTLGDVSRQLVYASGSSRTVLTFTYTAKAGESLSPTTVAVPSPGIALPAAAGIADRAGNAFKAVAAPTAIALSAASIAENNPIGAVVGQLSTTDPDAGDRFTYQMVPGDGAADNAAFEIVGDQLRARVAFDFEARAAHAVRVRSVDTGGRSVERAFVIAVTDVNEAPVIMSPATAAVPENTTPVQTVTATDPDAGARLTYSIVGGADAAAFSIVAATGVLAFHSAPDFEAPTDTGGDNVYDVVVQASDGALAATRAIAVTVTNVSDVKLIERVTGLPNTAGTRTAVRLADAVIDDPGYAGGQLRLSGPDAAKFDLVGNSLFMRAGTPLDAARQSRLSATVTIVAPAGPVVLPPLDFEYVMNVSGDPVTMQMVTVGNPGNAADTSAKAYREGRGDVAYSFDIGTYEVTIGQYVKFLNAVAKKDPNSLYDNDNLNFLDEVGGILQTTLDNGDFQYTAAVVDGQDTSQRPVGYLTWYSAARFANWMANGQPTGPQGPATTEDGAYTLNGLFTPARNRTNPNTNGGPVTFSLPTGDEWHKAAYYSPNLNGGAGGYYVYATQSDTEPGKQIGNLPNQANVKLPPSDRTTNVGLFTGSPGFYGTFDQEGNVTEWNDDDSLMALLPVDNNRQRFQGGTSFNGMGEKPENAGSRQRRNGLRMAGEVKYTVPAAPQNFVAATGAGTVNLAWSQPFKDGGQPVTGYRIAYRELGDEQAAWLESETQYGASTFNGQVTGLDQKKQYEFAVRAVNSVGQGYHAFVGPVFPKALQSVLIDMVSVGNPGNSADAPQAGFAFGDVAQDFQIGRYEVTIGQYATFLNAVAKSDLVGNPLFNGSMFTNKNIAGIERKGSEPAYSYTVVGPEGGTPSGATAPGDRPITYVSWFDAARFANWMANGQPETGTFDSKTTENGAYDLGSLDALNGKAVPRNATNPNTGKAPTFWLPTVDEWYKAGFYSPALNGGAGGYYKYATESDVAPGNNLFAGGNQANVTVGGVWAVTGTFDANQNYLTNVGAFTSSSSFYGTYDQSGNVGEIMDPGSKKFNGNLVSIWAVSGHWASDRESASNGTFPAAPNNENAFFGFRLAGPAVPAAAALPAAPGKPQAVGSAGLVKLSWTKPPVNGSNAGITTYTIEYSSDGGTNWTTFQRPASPATSATLAGLVPGTPYTFRVSAVNAAGTGPASPVSDAVTWTPLAPSNLQVRGEDQGVTLSWQAPANDGGSPITDYVVESSLDGQNWTVVTDGVGAATRTTIVGLTSATTYRFRVAAKNLYGSSPFTAASAEVATLSFVPAMVKVGNAGNAADVTGYGSVGYDYRIGTYEVTIGQYIKFLRAVASQSDPHGLYNDQMGFSNATGKILRSQAGDTFSYAFNGASGNAENSPITFVSWFDAARFANWMANGQPIGPAASTTTENGAYDLTANPAGAVPLNAVNPNTGAAPIYSIPTENEWYKAAYYSPAKDNGSDVPPGGYYSYATGSDFSTLSNYGNPTPNLSLGYLKPVGFYQTVENPYGTFDMNGNVAEWNDLDGSAGGTRGERGGSWKTGDQSILDKSTRFVQNVTSETSDGLGFGTTGFRLASRFVSATPAAPTNVTAVPGAAGTATVSWASPVSDGGKPILAYTVYWRLVGSQDWLGNDVSKSVSRATIGNLASGTYEFRVGAYNDDQTAYSATSNAVMIA